MKEQIMTSYLLATTQAAPWWALVLVLALIGLMAAACVLSDPERKP